MSGSFQPPGAANWVIAACLSRMPLYHDKRIHLKHIKEEEGGKKKERKKKRKIDSKTSFRESKSRDIT